MKRFLWVLVALALGYGAFNILPGKGGIAVTIIEAQSLPVTKNVAWDANPVADGVLDYTISLDGVVVGTTATLTIPVTFTTQGAHTITAVARNIWGTGPIATLIVVVKLPDAPRNVRIP